MRYAKYKETGISWLPKVPEGWDERKMKYLFSERSDKGHPEEEPLCSTQAYGVIPQSVYENRIVVVDAKNRDQLKLVKKGDFVISLRAFQGGIEIAHHRGIISAAYTILELRDSSFSSYFRWLFKSQPFIELLKTCVTGIREGQNINYPLLSRKYLPLPPLSEQRAIAESLDDKCSKVDRLVAAKTKEVKLLKELRERVIADAVTGRGYGKREEFLTQRRDAPATKSSGCLSEANPKGRKGPRGAENVSGERKFKASGIPWLPEVPEGWEVVRNKSFMTLTDEKVGDRKGQFPLLSLTKQGVIIRDISTGKGKFPKDYDTYLVVKPNNLIFCLFDIEETPRTVGLVRNIGMLTGAYTNFEINTNMVLPEFAYYYYLFVDEGKRLSPYYTGLRKVVKTNTFLSLRFPLPPLSEQRAIVDYIEQKCAKIDALQKKLEDEVQRLKEFRERLVADVVTGQRKVV